MTSTMRGGFNDCQRFSGVVGCNVSGDGRRLKDQVLPDVVREPAAVIESLVVAQSFLYDGIGRALRNLSETTCSRQCMGSTARSSFVICSGCFRNILVHLSLHRFGSMGDTLGHQDNR